MSRAAPPNGSSSGMLPNAPPMLYPYDLGYKFNATMAIIVVVLVTTFFFMALFVLYIRRCNMGGGGGGGGGALQRQRNTAQQQQQQQRLHGLEPEALAKFPLIRYASIKAPKKGKAGVECAVCLLQFEDDETLRLLPPCGHVFHAECIDMWLHSHSTCPLCRRSLDASGHLQRALSAVVNSFRRDSNSNSLAEGRAAAAAEADLEAGQVEAEVEADVVGSRRREIVRTLSRNSESFKVAAHDQELRELRERLRATSARFNKDETVTRESSSRLRSFLSFRSPTIHHSHSATLLAEESESTKAQPKEDPAADADHASLRRSVSDGESLATTIAQHKLWVGESSAPPTSNNPETNRAAFRAFARRSFKWLVGKDSSTSSNGSENHQK